MGTNAMIRAAAAIVLAGLAVAMYLSSVQFWQVVLSLVCILILFAGHKPAKKQDDSHLHLTMVSKANTLQLLSKYRHDYMNQIQLVKAYIQLGNTERAKQALNQIVDDARRHSGFSHLFNPLVSFAVVKAALDFSGVQFDVLSNLDSEMPDDSVSLGTDRTVKPHRLGLSASVHLGDVIYSLYALAQEMQEDTSAALKWTLHLVPDGTGMRLKLILSGDAITDTFTQEITDLLGNQSLIVQGIHWAEHRQGEEKDTLEITARLVSLTAEPVWVTA